MKVFVQKLQDRTQLTEAEDTNTIRIETVEGITYSIRENYDGSLTVHECTYRHLAVHPETANSIRVGVTE